MIKILMVFIGGGVGCVLRYFISEYTRGWSGASGFPVGTLLCNITGCFLIGLLSSMVVRMGWSSEVRLLLTVGLCGGFTTFSTFSNEGVSMLQSGNYLQYALYTSLSIILGLLAVISAVALQH